MWIQPRTCTHTILYTICALASTLKFTKLRVLMIFLLLIKKKKNKKNYMYFNELGKKKKIIMTIGEVRIMSSIFFKKSVGSNLKNVSSGLRVKRKINR
jgi:hypothetical protein